MLAFWSQISSTEKQCYFYHINLEILNLTLQTLNTIFFKEIPYLLYFFVLLFPLTTEHNRTGYRYKIGVKSINHLFYMDDLNLFAKDHHKMKWLPQKVKKFSDDIKVWTKKIHECILPKKKPWKFNINRIR